MEKDDENRAERHEDEKVDIDKVLDDPPIAPSRHPDLSKQSEKPKGSIKERLLYGKEYTETTDINKKLAIVKQGFFILSICSLFLAGVAVGVVFYEYIIPYLEGKQYQYKDIDVLLAEREIVYDGLNEAESAVVNEILHDLKPLYLERNNGSIILAKNMSKYCDSCTGRNIGDGMKVIVEYRRSELAMRTTLCHELLHSYFDNDDAETDVNHRVIYDLADYTPCFRP